MTECGCNCDPKTVIGFFATYFFEEKVSKNLFIELRGCSHIVIKTATHKLMRLIYVAFSKATARRVGELIFN